MIYVQIALLLILLALQVYSERKQHEITRRLDALLEEHGQLPVEAPDPDPHHAARSVRDGVRRMLNARNTQ